MSKYQHMDMPGSNASPIFLALKTKAAMGQRQAATRAGTPAATVGKTAANH